LFAPASGTSPRCDAPAGLFPWTIASASLVLAIVNVAGGLRAPRAPAPGDDDPPAEPPDSARRTLAICAWILGMYAAIWLVGFSLATLVTTLLYLRAARERWPLSVGLSLGGFAFVYGLFEKGLGVPFPPRPLFVLVGVVSSRGSPRQ